MFSLVLSIVHTGNSPGVTGNSVRATGISLDTGRNCLESDDELGDYGASEVEADYVFQFQDSPGKKNLFVFWKKT